MGATVPVLVSVQAGDAGPALGHPNHTPQPPVAFPAWLLGTELVVGLSPQGPAGSILPSPCFTQCSSLQPMGRSNAGFIPCHLLQAYLLQVS